MPCTLRVLFFNLVSDFQSDQNGTSPRRSLMPHLCDGVARQGRCLILFIVAVIYLASTVHQLGMDVVKTLFSPFEYEELRLKRELCSVMNPVKELGETL